MSKSELYIFHNTPLIIKERSVRTSFYGVKLDSSGKTVNIFIVNFYLQFVFSVFDSAYSAS